MKLLHWTVFLDLLGYRELNGDVVNEEKAQELLEFMNSNKEVFEKQNNNPDMKKHYSQSSYNLYEHYTISFAFISDSLIVSYTPNLDKDFDEDIALRHSANSLLIILQRLRLLIYKCALEKKIFLRGGISNDYSYIKGNFAVGKGVGSAYKAETQAKYPRVILAEDVVKNEKLMKSIDLLSDMMYSVSFIKDDGDGVKYLDFNTFGRITLDAKSGNPYVIRNAINNPENYAETINSEGGMLRAYKEAIEFQIKKALVLKDSTLSEEQRLYKSLKEKYLWLSNYHNNSCEEFSKLSIAIPKSVAKPNPRTYGLCLFLLRLIPAILEFKIDESLLKDLNDN